MARQKDKVAPQLVRTGLRALLFFYHTSGFYLANANHTQVGAAAATTQSLPISANDEARSNARTKRVFVGEKKV
jgi:hypothetical protein